MHQVEPGRLELSNLRPQEVQYQNVVLAPEGLCYPIPAVLV